MTEHRYSFGGLIVANSLRDVGFSVDTQGVELVETARPKQHRPTSMLVQSLWNVLPVGEFYAALRPYPRRMRARAVARRELARVNLRRANRVVCLTDAMAKFTECFARRDVDVSPVCLPADAAEIPGRPRAVSGDGTVLVPGTVTWYKRPHEALKWVAGQSEALDCVRLAGKDDGSGCLESVRALADDLKLELIHEPLTREEMWRAVMESSVTVLPSSLESLGFSLGEALWRGQRVVASPIPAHLEVARRVGLAPTWLGEPPGNVCPNTDCVQPGEIAAQWKLVGLALGLEPRL